MEFPKVGSKWVGKYSENTYQVVGKNRLGDVVTEFLDPMGVGLLEKHPLKAFYGYMLKAKKQKTAYGYGSIFLCDASTKEEMQRIVDRHNKNSDGKFYYQVIEHTFEVDDE